MIYFIRKGRQGPIKIGFSVDPERRLQQLQVGSAEKLNLLAVLPGRWDEEECLHQRFAEHRMEGEWFEPVEAIQALLRSASVSQMKEAIDSDIDDERVKDEAYEKYKASASTQEKLEALLMVINSHYVRSNRGREWHPEFDTFASHWLVAQKDGWAWCPKEIINLAQKHYPPPEESLISGGSSYWPR